MRFFGRNLRYLMGLKDENQTELALKFGMSRGQISNYVNDVSYPTMDVAFQFCEYYGLGLDDLFRRSLVPDDEPPDGKTHPLSKAGVLEENDVGATESPPQIQGEVKEMKKQLLEMMLKLEGMDG